MFRNTRFWRSISVIIWLAAFVLLPGDDAIAQEQSPGNSTLQEHIGRTVISAPDTRVLERRLIDANCYSGPVDGVESQALNAAIRQCPDQQAFLRIETGMHAIAIKRIGVDNSCSIAATVSDDKTVRLWSLPDGKPMDVFRLPIGEGHAGKLFAVAISPDGFQLAAGGYDPAAERTGKISLAIIDLRSRTIHRVGAEQDSIVRTAFSPDGTRVAVGLIDGGVRVFEVATGKLLLADKNYGGPAYGLAFAPNGKLFVAAFDGLIRRYGADHHLESKQLVHSGAKLYSIAMAPSGRQLVVGSMNTPTIPIIDTNSLTIVAFADTGDLIGGDLKAVAWSRDEKTILAGGTASEAYGNRQSYIVRRFDEKSRRKGSDTAVATDSISDLQACRSGFVFSSSEPSFGFISNNGLPKILQESKKADLRDMRGDVFAVSNSGIKVRFRLKPEDPQPIVFDLEAQTLVPERTASNDLYQPP